MATTNSGFLKATIGGSVVLFPATAANIQNAVNIFSATRLDTLVNHATAGYAKNGANRFTFSGTTPKTLSLIDLTSNAQSYGGDTVFATYTALTFFNDGAATLKIAIGASNGATFGLGATPGGTDTPYFSLGAGEKRVVLVATPVTIDSTHKNFDITPTSGGSLVVIVGGA